MADHRSTDKLASTPLPPGWEAKYDYVQRRYFFIDHQTKATTWLDPRLKQQQPQPPTAVSNVAAEHKSARHSPKPGGQPGKHATVGWQSQVEDKYGMKVEIIKDDSNDVEPEAIKRMMLRFPTVGKELVAMVSADCTSEEDVCQKLRDMGYREDKQAAMSTGGKTTGGGSRTGSPAPFGSKSPSHNEKLVTTSGSSRPSSGTFQVALSAFGAPSSDPSSASPGSKQHSKKSSPDRATAPKSTVQSNAGERRSVSPARHSKGKGSGHKSHTAGGQTSAKASPLTEPSADKKKRMREKLEQEFKSQEKSVVESTLASCLYDEEKTRFELQLLSITKSASEAATSSSTTTVTPSYGVNGSEAHKNYSNAAVAAAAAAAAAAVPASSATDAHESSPTVADGSSSSSEHFGHFGHYSSALRHDTMGANASLAKGPNKDLLLSDYILETGSQSSYCHGPCKENYHGPCSELRQGHQPGIAKGPACLYGVASD